MVENPEISDAHMQGFRFGYEQVGKPLLGLMSREVLDQYTRQRESLSELVIFHQSLLRGEGSREIAESIRDMAQIMPDEIKSPFLLGAARAISPYVASSGLLATDSGMELAGIFKAWGYSIQTTQDALKKAGYGSVIREDPKKRKCLVTVYEVGNSVPPVTASVLWE